MYSLSAYCGAVVVAEDLMIITMDLLLKPHQPKRKFVREGKLHRHWITFPGAQERKRPKAAFALCSAHSHCMLVD